MSQLNFGPWRLTFRRSLYNPTDAEVGENKDKPNSALTHVLNVLSFQALNPQIVDNRQSGKFLPTVKSSCECAYPLPETLAHSVNHIHQQLCTFRRAENPPRNKTVKINVPPCRNFSFYTQIKTNIELGFHAYMGELQSRDGQRTVELKWKQVAHLQHRACLTNDPPSPVTFFEHSDKLLRRSLTSHYWSVFVKGNIVANSGSHLSKVKKRHQYEWIVRGAPSLSRDERGAGSLPSSGP